MGKACWWDHPPPTVLADPVLPHAKCTMSCSWCAGTQRMQRAVTRAHARWVSWLRVLAAGCTLLVPQAGALSSSVSPGARRVPWPAEAAGIAQEAWNSPVPVDQRRGSELQGLMLSIRAPVGTVPPGVALAGAAPAASPHWGHDRHVPGLGGSALAPHAAVGSLWVPSLQLHLPCPHASPWGTLAGPWVPEQHPQSWPAWRETPQPASGGDAPCGGAVWCLVHPRVSPWVQGIPQHPSTGAEHPFHPHAAGFKYHREAGQASASPGSLAAGRGPRCGAHQGGL